MSRIENHSAVLPLLDECIRPLVLYARQWDEIDAEDVVQEAFLRLLGETPFPDSPRAWLFRVVRNLAIDHSRHEKNVKQKNIVGSWFEPNVEPIGKFDDLTEALQQLLPDIREIIISKIWGNLTFREIAELTNRPISSVHHDYQAGIDTLRGLLE